MGIIGAAVGAVGQIAGGIASRKGARKQRRMLENQLRENQAWFDRRYNENATERADTQAMLNKVEESIRKRNRAAAGTAAVMGGTDESVAAAKEANNQALADVTSDVLAKNEVRKEGIENAYMQQKNALQGQLMELEGAKQEAIAGAVQGVSEAAQSMPF